MRKKVACFGSKGSFSYQMAEIMFPDYEIAPLKNIEDVFDAVRSGCCQFGVAPIENSNFGEVKATENVLMEEENIKIIKEGYLEVAFHLTGIYNKKEDIKEIFAHEVAAGQCRKWLKENFPNIEVTTGIGSNSDVALKTSHNANSAAITNSKSIEEHNLEKREKNIGDKKAVTRFIAFSKDIKISTPTKKDKTSLRLNVKHKVGRLWLALTVFLFLLINMEKLRSFPNGNGGEFAYGFLVDIRGHQHKWNVAFAIKVLQIACNKVDILGSYPIGKKPKI